MWNLHMEDIVGIAGVALGALGVILAIFFYYRGRKYKRLTYLSRSFSLLGESIALIPGFSAQYTGKSLSTLSASKVLLWNSGNDVINKDDIAPADPLQIHFGENTKVLEAKISSETQRANQAKAHILPDSEHLVEIDFDYLDKKEGILVSLLHTGKGPSLPRVCGTVKGGSNPEQYDEKSTWYRRWGRALGLTASITLLIIVIIMKTIDTFNLFIYSNFQKKTIMVIAEIAIIMTMISIIVDLIKPKKSRKELDDAFDSEFTPETFNSR